MRLHSWAKARATGSAAAMVLASVLGLVLGLPRVGVSALVPPAAMSAAASTGVQGTPTSDGPAPVWPAGSGRFSLAGQPRWWPAAASADLVATGVHVVLRPGLVGMEVDRRGALWLFGPWLVARVDPRTRSAMQWDPGDDRAFAEVTSLRPAADEGVWLIAPERVLLFDGVRFVRDLPVPARYRANSPVTDVVDLGSEVWVSSAGGVARCVEGVWSWVAPDQIADVRTLAVDSGGFVWAVGRLGESADSRLAVARFDAGRWQGPHRTGMPRDIQDVVADPTAEGVLVRSRTGVGRLTATGWRPSARARAGTPRDLAAAQDDGIWVLGEAAIWHTDRIGHWQKHAQDRADSAVALAQVGDDLWVADPRGLLRLRNAGLRRVWTADLKAPLASTRPQSQPATSSAAPGQPLRVPADRVLVGSRDLLWVSVGGYPFPFRFAGDRWHEVARDLPPWTGLPVIAADQAIWIPTRSGPARVSEARAQMVPVAATDDVLYPDGQGGVWVTPDRWYGWLYASGSGGTAPPGRVLTLVGPRGPRGTVPLPRGVWQLTGLFPGAEGTLWATSCGGQVMAATCSSAPDLDRWDGRAWTVVPYPGSNVGGVGVHDDAFWAWLWRDDPADTAPVLARYGDHGWTSFPQVGVLNDPTITAAGEVCGGQDEDRTLVCVDRAGRVTRQALPIGDLLSVGPDGSVWVGHFGAVARVDLRNGG